jgi:hypothetical protein
VLLEAVLKIHLRSRHLLEQLLLQDSHLSLQMVYTHHQEQQAVLVMEIHQFLNCSPISEQHLLLELVRQITQLFIQISERHMVLVRLLPEIRRQDCTLHQEQQLLMGQVHLYLKKEQHSSELHLPMVSVRQHLVNCELFIEPVLHQGSLTRLHLSGTEN